MADVRCQSKARKPSSLGSYRHISSVGKRTSSWASMGTGGCANTGSGAYAVTVAAVGGGEHIGGDYSIPGHGRHMVHKRNDSARAHVPLLLVTRPDDDVRKYM